MIAVILYALKVFFNQEFTNETSSDITFPCFKFDLKTFAYTSRGLRRALARFHSHMINEEVIGSPE